MEGAVEGTKRREQQGALADFASCCIENVARQKMLELFLATGDATEEKNHPRRCYDERNSNNCFLRNRAFLGTARPAEERCADERYGERNPERDAVVEMISHQ